MKKLTLGVSVVTAMTLLSGLAMAENGLTEQAQFPFQFAPEQGKTVEVAIKGEQVVAHLPEGKSQHLVPKSDVEDASGMGDNHPAVAQVGDFNFDGWQDVAVLNGNGYGGVNLFYQVFLWDKAKQQLHAFDEAVSNPSLDAKNQELNTASRDGPAWSSTTYRVVKGQLYAAVESKMVGTDGAWEYYEFKNPAGKVIGHKVLGESGSPEQKAEDAPNASAVIVVDKAMLHDKPQASAQTKMYVIKGDKVTLLDWKAGDDGDFGAGWFLVRYEGKKTLEKWVKGDALEAAQ